MNIAKGTVSRIVLPHQHEYSEPILVGPSGSVTIQYSFIHEIYTLKYQLEVCVEDGPVPVVDNRFWSSITAIGGDSQYYVYMKNPKRRSYTDIQTGLVPGTYVRFVIVGLEGAGNFGVNYRIFTDSESLNTTERQSTPCWTSNGRGINTFTDPVQVGQAGRVSVTTSDFRKTGTYELELLMSTSENMPTPSYTRDQNGEFRKEWASVPNHFVRDVQADCATSLVATGFIPGTWVRVRAYCQETKHDGGGLFNVNVTT